MDQAPETVPIPQPPQRNLKSLDISWREGIPSALMQAVIDYYLIPLALFLGATPLQIGLLVAIPNLLGSLAQLFAVQIVYLVGSHLRFLVAATRIQAVFLFPIAILAAFHFPGRPGLLIILMTIFRILANIIQTVWSALVSNYLPPEERGEYFGWRSQVQGIATVLSILFAGLLLFLTKKISLAAGFSILFLYTAASRILSSRLMSRMDNVSIPHSKKTDFTLLMFLAQFRKSNFVKFVFYVASISFSVNLAAPFFSVYMLKELHFSYLQFMLVQSIVSTMGILSFPIWGKHADRVGNATILRLTGFMIPLIPLVWIMARHFWQIILIESFSGLMWSGFNLCSVNFIFDAVTPPKRTRCLSYFNLINGIAIFTGASLGGWLYTHLPAFHGSKILTLFLISGVLRAGSAFLLSGRFKEVRSGTKKVSSSELFFSVVGIKPLLGRGETMESGSLFRKPDWLTGIKD